MKVNGGTSFTARLEVRRNSAPEALSPELYGRDDIVHELLVVRLEAVDDLVAAQRALQRADVGDHLLRERLRRESARLPAQPIVQRDVGGLRDHVREEEVRRAGTWPSACAPRSRDVEREIRSDKL